MTRLALCVVVWSPCAVLLADDPKKPVSVLEGTWQEPALPGEDVAARYKITIIGDKVTIHHRKQMLTGTIESHPGFEPVTITMRITTVEGEGSHMKGTYTGIYEVKKDRVSLHFNPLPVEVPESRWFPPSETEPRRTIEIIGPDGTKKQFVAPVADFQKRGMHVAPFTLTLHKVKK